MNEMAQQLDTLVQGRVLGPGSDAYDEERTGFQLLDPHRPGAVVVAAGAGDVRAAVAFAAERGEPLAVQATGHGLARPTGGVLVSTRRMNGVRVDPGARTAWVEAGATWRDVITAAAPHGLAPLSGSFPGVGAVSYTLGGGVGLMARRYGFAADHVRRVDLVTPADARLRTVTADSDPELFWALRGGGGNLGAVTGMEIGLVPVDRIFGGGLFFDTAQVPGVLDAWRRWTAGVPEEMSSAVSMLPYPDLPVLPEPLRGRHVAQIQIAYLGPEEEGRRLVEPLRSLGPLLRDTLRVLPYTESGQVFDEPDRPHAYRSQALLLRDLEAGALDDLMKAAGPAAPVMCVVGLRHLGGALSRAPRVPAAVGHRDAAYSVMVLSPVEPGQEEAVRRVHDEALAPLGSLSLGRSLNFSYGPLEEEQVRSAFAPADYERLTQLRARHDPGGLLRPNHVIPPAR